MGVGIGSGRVLYTCRLVEGEAADVGERVAGIVGGGRAFRLRFA